MSGPSPPLPAAGSLSGTGSFTALAPSLAPCASSRAAPSPASLKRHTPWYRRPGEGWGMLSRVALGVSGDSQHPQRMTGSSHEQSPLLWAALHLQCGNVQPNLGAGETPRVMLWH